LNEPTVDGESFSSGSTLFMVAAEWRGPANMFDGPPSGQVVTSTVMVPGADWP
jgi:hypothetical protein